MTSALQVKSDAISVLHGLFVSSQAAYLLDFRSCKCKDLTVLRRKLAESGAKISVIKNKLAKRAVIGTSSSVLDDFFVGPTAVVWSFDPVSSAKVVSGFLKDREDLRWKVGVVCGEVIDSVRLGALADMPSKERLQAGLLAQINAPAVQLLRTVVAPAEQLVRVINAWCKKLEGEASS